MRKLLALVVSFLLPTLSAWSAGEESRVVILANADDADSMQIARYYAGKRGVPAENIIALPMSKTETIGWREFLLSIWQPLQDELVKRSWIDAIPMQSFDEIGRRKMAFNGHRMSYLVVCRGVPLRISNDPALITEIAGASGRAEFKVNQSAVDSELSLLAFGDYKITAFVQNPLFRQKTPPALVADTIVKVSRLDGPTPANVLSMIDRTLEAEKRGLIGRAYVDVKGPHAQGEQWMERVVTELEKLDFSPQVNRDPGTFPATARFDAPALYFGWYATNVNGPFTLPGFAFAPGAVAVHIHSFSAQTLRSDTAGWCGPLVARGVSLTCGAVFEPYLQLMHFPQLMLEALARGETAGDAAYYALPALSWQNVLIGDPLYRPFKRSLDEQWSNRAHLPASLAPYVTLREMQQLRTAGHLDDAIAVGSREQRDRPSLPVGIALASLLADKGDQEAAARTLGFAKYLTKLKSNDWALFKSAAELMKQSGNAADAVLLYNKLLGQGEIPESIRIDWLRDATKAANAAGNLKQAIIWEREITQLMAGKK